MLNKIDSPLTLYEQVAAYIQHLIQEGTLQAGDRIPSVRKLHRQLDVSLSTVLEAYRLLEDQGWVQARPQSGFYVKARHQVAEPTKLQISSPTPIEVSLAYQVSSTLRHPDMVQLGAAVPDESLFPIPALHRIMTRILRDASEAIHRYDVPPGSEMLRQSVVRRLVDAGCILSPQDIVITNGATEAIFLALKAVTKPGDAVVIESPCYYSFLEILQALHLKVIELPSSPQTGLSIPDLEDILTTQTIAAGLLVSNFSNPLGYLMTDAKKQKLVHVFNRYQVPLVEDDVYGALHFTGERPKALKAFDQQGLVIYCSSVSKTLSPGLRVGWCAPGRFLLPITQLKLAMNLGSPLLPQLAVSTFIEQGGCDRHLRRLRRSYQIQIERMTQAIQSYFPAGTKVTRPKGGYLLWVELPPHIDAIEVYQAALTHKISIAPGVMFSPAQHYRNCLRLNCGLPGSDQLQSAMCLLGQLMHEIDKNWC